MNIVFTYPSFLWALFFGLVPLIIHLFNFRRYKTVYFSDTSLLEEVIQQSKSKREVKNWLLLLLRTLLILCLALLFAQPKMIDQTHEKEESHVLIVIDNSKSMLRKHGSETLLNQAKYFADKIVSSYSAQTRFKLLHLDNYNKAQFDLTKSAVQEKIAEINPSNASFKSELIIQKADYIAEDWDSDAVAHWFSDFDFKLEGTKIDTTLIKHVFYEFEADMNADVFVDSVAFLSAASLEDPYDKIRVMIDSSGNARNIPIKVSLLTNGRRIAQSSVILKDSGWVDLKIPNSNGNFFKGEVYLEGDAVNTNNLYFISYPRNETFKTLLVTDQPEISSALNKLYSIEERMELEKCSFNRIPYDKLNQFQTIIIAEPEKRNTGVIEKLLQSGINQTLVFIPTNHKNLEVNNSFVEPFQISFLEKKMERVEVGAINQKSMFYKNVFEEISEQQMKKDIAQFQEYYLTSNYSDWEVLMRFENEKPLLFRKENFILFTAPLSGSSFFQKPICVPTFLKIGSLSSNEMILSYEIGTDGSWKGRGSSKSVKVSHPKSSTFNWLSKVTSKFDFNNQFDFPGYYSVFEGEDTLGIIAMNIPSKEYKKVDNDLKSIHEIEVINEIDDASLKEARNGKELWPYLILCGILLILSEMWVSRWGRI